MLTYIIFEKKLKKIKKIKNENDQNFFNFVEGLKGNTVISYYNYIFKSNNIFLF